MPSTEVGDGLSNQCWYRHCSCSLDCSFQDPGRRKLPAQNHAEATKQDLHPSEQMKLAHSHHCSRLVMEGSTLWSSPGAAPARLQARDRAGCLFLTWPSLLHGKETCPLMQDISWAFISPPKTTHTHPCLRVLFPLTTRKCYTESSAGKHKVSDETQKN